MVKLGGGGGQGVGVYDRVKYQWIDILPKHWLFH